MSAPTAAEVADRLGKDPRRLVQFVDFHPDPSACNVLGWATADPQHHDAVEAWLADREESPQAITDDDDLAVDDERRGVLAR